MEQMGEAMEDTIGNGDTPPRKPSTSEENSLKRELNYPYNLAVLGIRPNTITRRNMLQNEFGGLEGLRVKLNVLHQREQVAAYVNGPARRSGISMESVARAPNVVRLTPKKVSVPAVNPSKLVGMP